MELLNPTTDAADEVAIATAVASLAFPPVSVGLVPDSWTSPARQIGVMPEFDIEIWSTGTLDLTDAELLGGKLKPLTVASTQIDSVTHGTETINEAAHGLLTGDGPIRLTTTGTLPAGLAVDTDYWVIKTAAGTFQLAASFADAMAATPVPVAFTDAGTGNHSYVGSADTRRVHFFHHGYLLESIPLTNQRGYSARCDHRPEVVCYALVGTLSAGSLSASMHPVALR